MGHMPVSARHLDPDFDSPPPRVPADTRVYALGDIHGRLDLLQDIHEQIQADATDGPTRQVLVYLGDYIDRGRQSFDVIEALIHEPLAGFESIHLKGNHEDFLLRFLEHGEQGENWFFNGGVATLNSYRVADVSMSDMYGDLDRVRDAFIAAMPAAHVAFYQRLKLMHSEADYLFVHAGIRPGVPVSRQTDNDLMWIRGPFLHTDEVFPQFVVHGHTPEFEPVIRHNRIGVDTQAYRSGVLTCLVLEGSGQRFLQT